MAAVLYAERISTKRRTADMPEYIPFKDAVMLFAVPMLSLMLGFCSRRLQMRVASVIIVVMCLLVYTVGVK
jgi:ammonia channel protein AmtB